jgi:hypothetical protein
MDDVLVVRRAEYELALRALSEHMQRMWMRFNFFLTLESGLAVGLVFVRDEGTFTDTALYFLVGQALLSAVWWVFGSQDRYLVRTYREEIARRWELVKESAGPQLPADLPYAGHIPEPGGRLDARSPIDWRLRPVCTTRLPAVFPLFLTVVWLVLIAVHLAAR